MKQETKDEIIYYIKRILHVVIAIGGALTGLHTLKYAMRVDDPKALAIGFVLTLLSGMLIQKLPSKEDIDKECGITGETNASS
jgi:hypothetical protein